MSIVVLVGSGEFTPAMIEVDKYLLTLLPNQAKVAILPTAAGKEIDYHKWIDSGIEHFRPLGANVYGVPIIDIETVSPTNLKLLEQADFIYLSGGDPGYLWSVIKDSQLQELLNRRIKENNFILAGCSAGAMVIGEYIPANIHAMFGTGHSTDWVKALGMVNCSALPHYDYMLKSEKELLNRVLKNIPAAAEKSLLGIDENTAIIIGQQWQVMGKGRAHFLAAKQTFQNSQTIPPKLLAK